MRAFAGVSIAAAIACSSPKVAPPAPAPSPEPRLRTTMVVGDVYRPESGDSALAAWTPDTPPFDSGGVCNVAKPFGPGVTVVTATFPLNDSTARTSLSITFDSAGHVVRFSDRRGMVRLPRGITADQLDSARRAAEAKVRSTSISFDYPLNQAVAVNSGGGKPTVAVIGPIRSMENLEKLGPPTKRIQRLRAFCGV